MQRLVIGATIASLACFLTDPACAQDAPAYAQPVGNTTLAGTVVRFTPGSYDLRLRDDRGFVDRIALHDGTIITPTGLDLTPGMRVAVTGYAAGSSFVANEIDRRDRRRFETSWRRLWIAPGTESEQNPPAPPVAGARPVR